MIRKYQYTRENYCRKKRNAKNRDDKKDVENILGLIGYRTIYSVHHNTKTILCVMRTYSQVMHKYPNLLNRDFYADNLIRNSGRIFHTYKHCTAFCIFRLSEICTTTA